MSFWNWSRRATSLVATLLAVSMLSACDDPGSTATKKARADIKVLIPQGLASTDVARLGIVVEGPGIATPIAAELGRNGSVWEGVIQDIPAGDNRLFTATAYDSGSIALYKGQAGPLSILPASTVSVAIVLQPVNPPLPFENVAPLIESVAVSSNPVRPGGTVTLTARAVDPNPTDTLSYTWSAPAGSFGSPTSATTSFTAPAQAGVLRLQLEVKDSRAASTTMSLDLHVQDPASSGTAVVSASFNTWPSISSMTGTPSPLVPGVPTSLFVSATDAEGDALSFSWSGNCPGSFDTRSSPQVVFTLSPQPSTPSCAFQVLVSDGRGGQQKGTLTLHVRDNPSPHVSGVRNRYYVVDDSLRHPVPEDLSGATIGAWVPTADGSGYEYRAGTGRPDGTFFIPDVQRTPYLLQFGTSYFWLTSRNPDLSAARLGRPDVEPLPEGTLMELQLSSPVPWRDGHELQLHSPGAGLGYLPAAACASPFFPAQEGSPFISGTIDYVESLQGCGLTSGRFDGSRGDILYVSHLESRSNPDSGATIQEARHVFQTRSLPESAPGTLLLSGSLSPLPLTQQPVDFRASEFEAQALAAHPNAVRSRANFLSIGTLPGFLEFGTYAPWPDLVYVSAPVPGQGDSLETFEYGDPYPSHWTRFVTGRASARVYYSVELPDGTTSSPSSITVSADSLEPLRPGTTHVLQPRVGPPQALRLNGLPATTSLSDVGPTPLVSWEAPALGVPTHYLVRVYRFSATSSGGTSRARLGTFRTTQTELRLPPDLLVSGSTYALEVSADMESPYDLSRPYLGGSTRYFASALTSGFKP